MTNLLNLISLWALPVIIIGILTFVFLAIIALVTYHNTGSYKNEEEFQ